jgi:hypothetical protein
MILKCIKAEFSRLRLSSTILQKFSRQIVLAAVTGAVAYRPCKTLTQDPTIFLALQSLIGLSGKDWANFV